MDALQQLQSIWHRDIPITAAMGVEIAAFEADELCVSASLAANVNVHGTAFAGSLYAVCALTGWGLIWLKLKARGLAAEIVLAEAGIRYRRAVRDDIVCRCRWSGAAEQQLDAFGATGRARLGLACDVVADGVSAVRFSGEFALRKP